MSDTFTSKDNLEKIFNLQTHGLELLEEAWEPGENPNRAVLLRDQNTTHYTIQQL